MADNYLEKKYEEFQRGRTVVRKTGPSLEILLRRACEVPEGEECGYEVKRAQLDAIARAASIVDGSTSFDVREEDASISVTGAGDGVCAGQVLLAMRLKAAELGLHASVEVESDAFCLVRIFKAR